MVLGCANQAGEDNRNIARMALLLAGLPESVPGSTVNRLCGSSLDAVAVASRAIAAGEASLMIAGGVESMSRAPFVMSKSEAPFGRQVTLEDTTLGWRFVNPEMQRRYGIDSMAETAENVAAEHAISRPGPGPICAPQPAARRRRPAGRASRRRDRAGRGHAEEGRCDGECR